MLAAGIKTPVPLEELESHLREEIERQTKSGANSEQAFKLAAEQIGKGESLQEEFRKVEEVERIRKSEQRKRRHEWVDRFTLVEGALFVPGCIAFGLFSRRREMSTGQILLCLGALVTSILFTLVGRRFGKIVPTIRDRRLQFAAFLGPIFLYIALFEWVCNFVALDMAHLGIFFFWMFAPACGFMRCYIEWFERGEAARWEARIANA